jgi:DNA-binding response OmpR family regulator
MPRIFLLENDSTFAQKLLLQLQKDHYQVEWKKSLGDVSAERGEVLPDLYILSGDLKDGEGIQLLINIRARGDDAPIFIISKTQDEQSAVQAFKLGATDYLRQPMGFEEIVVRIKRSLREVLLPDDQIRYQCLMLDRMTRKVMAFDRALKLTPKEFEILENLLKKSENVVSREELMNQIDASGSINDRNLDTHVSHLRRKLNRSTKGQIQITSIYGIGYKLEKV